MPGAIVALARTHMRHPMNIRAEHVTDSATVPATAQFIYQVHDLDKPEIIARILQADDAEKVIVFTRTKRQAQRVAEDLSERGFNASPLHGDMAQIARERALTKFRDGKLRVLVATDVAARGIDVLGVSHVINYSCPEDEKVYVHRIGRTGRAGATGTAVTFVDWADVHRWKMINKALDLPFDEPQETYSTSAHLYHDLGIPTEVQGSIAAPRPTRPERAAGAGSEGRERTPRERPARNRQRVRTRGGQRAAGHAEAAAHAEESATTTETTTTTKPARTGQKAGTGEQPTSGEHSDVRPRSRSRRRRRRGSGAGTGPQTAQ
jgi:superfamily II DNA/RNA helicase